MTRRRNLYLELAKVTRRAFVPRLFTQVYIWGNPLLERLLGISREWQLIWGRPNRDMKRERRRQYLAHKALEGF